VRNIVVIGLGALGRRHLQSLYELEDVKLYGVDNNRETLDRLRDEFSDVSFFDTVEDIPYDISLCIIATNSNVRCSVFRELMAHSRVKYLIFEKVLFQKLEDYYYVSEVLARQKTKAWVNCARREWSSYEMIKKELAGEERFTYTVTGANWGLCCNGIHMIDLLQYLTDSKEFTVDSSRFLTGIKESKRKGFKEINGTIAGNCGKCAFFQISCMPGEDTPSYIIINSENKSIAIDEAQNKAYISRRNNEWKWEKLDFIVEYQSQLSGRIAKRILDYGECKLPEYNFSMYTHIKYIEMFMEEFKKQGWEEERCPIT